MPDMQGIDDPLVEAEQQEYELGGRDWFALATGLNVAFVVCSLVCKPPQTVTLSLTARLRASAIYIVLACVAGALGTWATLPEDSWGSFRRLARCGLRGWVFLPAIALFLQRGSEWAAVPAAVAPALVARALLRFGGAGRRGDPPPLSSERRLFAAEVRTAPPSWVPFGLAACLYGAFVAAATGRIVSFTWLLASASFLFVFKLSAKPKKAAWSLSDRSSRLSSLVAVSFYCALLALSTARVWHDPLLGLGRASVSFAPTKQKVAREGSSSGYQTVVLWPLEERKREFRRRRCIAISCLWERLSHGSFRFMDRTGTSKFGVRCRGRMRERRAAIR